MYCGGHASTKMGRLVDNELFYCDDYGLELKEAKCWQRSDTQCHEHCVSFACGDMYFYCGHMSIAKNWLADFKDKKKQIEDEKQRYEYVKKEREDLRAELIKVMGERDKAKNALSEALREKKPRKAREKKVKE